MQECNYDNAAQAAATTYLAQGDSPLRAPAFLTCPQASGTNLQYHQQYDTVSTVERYLLACGDIPPWTCGST